MRKTPTSGKSGGSGVLLLPLPHREVGHRELELARVLADDVWELRDKKKEENTTKYEREEAHTCGTTHTRGGGKKSDRPGLP